MSVSLKRPVVHIPSLDAPAVVGRSLHRDPLSAASTNANLLATGLAQHNVERTPEAVGVEGSSAGRTNPRRHPSPTTAAKSIRTRSPVPVSQRPAWGANSSTPRKGSIPRSRSSSNSTTTEAQATNPLVEEHHAPLSHLNRAPHHKPSVAPRDASLRHRHSDVAGAPPATATQQQLPLSGSQRHYAQDTVCRSASSASMGGPPTTVAKTAPAPAANAARDSPKATLSSGKTVGRKAANVDEEGQRSMAARMMELEASNRMLRGLMESTMRELQLFKDAYQSERAETLAELHALREKVLLASVRGCGEGAMNSSSSAATLMAKLTPQRQRSGGDRERHEEESRLVGAALGGDAIEFYDPPQMVERCLDLHFE